MYSFWGLVALVVLVAALAGCGDDGSDQSTTTVSSPQPGSETAKPPPDEGGERTGIAALGDSITAGSPLWDPDPAIREQIGPALDKQSQFEYWAEQKDPSLRFTNCGVFGERTDEIATRLDSCVAETDAAGGTDLLVVQGGINDIAQGRPVDQAAADLRAMVEEGLSRGLEVAIIDVLPWNNGFPGAAKPIKQLNEEIAQIAKDNEIPLLPFFATLDNPAQTGTMPPGLTIDGDHPSVDGYERLAEKAVLPNLP